MGKLVDVSEVIALVYNLSDDRQEIVEKIKNISKDAMIITWDHT